MKEKRPNRYLRRERELRGWSQRTVAERVGTDEPGVSRWENGYHKPSRYFQTKLCDLFGKSAEELGFMKMPTQEERPKFIGIDTKEDGILSSGISIPIQNQETDTSQKSSNSATQFFIEIISTLLRQDKDLSLLSLLSLLQGEGAVIARKSDEPVNRRDATKTIGMFGSQLLGLPLWEHLSKTTTASLSTSIEAINHLEQLGDVCWHLVNDSQDVMVAQILPAYLSELTLLIGYSSPHQSRIARLLTRGYILAAEIEKKNLIAMRIYCEQAVMYSQMTNDDSIKVDALRQKATITLIAKELSHAVLAYQQTLSMVNRVSPLLRSRIFLGLASAYARSGQEQEALKYLGLAHDSYPSVPENDASYLYLATSSNRAALHLYEALTYSDLQQLDNASKALMQVDGMHPKIPVIESTRIEFLNLQAKTAALTGDMERSGAYLTSSINIAKSQGYPLWLEEAYGVYLTLCQVWPHEKQVKNLATLFQQYA